MYRTNVPTFKQNCVCEHGFMPGKNVEDLFCQLQQEIVDEIIIITTIAQMCCFWISVPAFSIHIKSVVVSKKMDHKKSGIVECEFIIVLFFTTVSINGIMKTAYYLEILNIIEKVLVSNWKLMHHLKIIHDNDRKCMLKLFLKYLRDKNTIFLALTVPENPKLMGLMDLWS